MSCGGGNLTSNIFQADFLDHFDTPDTYASEALNALRVAASEDSLEFVTPTTLITGVDHGVFGGLSDDDHDIYFNLLGRTGGQIGIGGLDDADDLTLRANPNTSTPDTAGRIQIHDPIVFNLDEAMGASQLTSLMVFNQTVDQTGVADAIVLGFDFLPIIDTDMQQFLNATGAFNGSPISNQTAAIGGAHTDFTLAGYLAKPSAQVDFDGAGTPPNILMGYSGSFGTKRGPNSTSGTTVIAEAAAFYAFPQSLINFISPNQGAGCTITEFNHFKGRTANIFNYRSNGVIVNEIGFNTKLNLGSTSRIGAKIDTTRTNAADFGVLVVNDVRSEFNGDVQIVDDKLLMLGDATGGDATIGYVSADNQLVYDAITVGTIHKFKGGAIVLYDGVSIDIQPDLTTSPSSTNFIDFSPTYNNTSGVDKMFIIDPIITHSDFSTFTIIRDSGTYIQGAGNAGIGPKFALFPTNISSVNAVSPPDGTTFDLSPTLSYEANGTVTQDINPKHFDLNWFFNANATSGSANYTITKAVSFEDSMTVRAQNAGDTMTLTDRVGYDFRDATLVATGTVNFTTQTVIDIEDLTSADNNIGIASAMTASSTNFFIDHSGTAQSRFGGNVDFEQGIYKARTTQVGNYTALLTDYAITFNLSADALCTLPDPTTNAGQELKIRGHYSNTTEEVSFSEDINGDSNFVLFGNETIVIQSNGTEYLS